MNTAMTEHERTFEGWAYRTSARFGSRVTVVVAGDTVSVTGPRVSVAVYHLWTGAQFALFGLTLAALVAAAISWDWRFLVAAILLFLAHGAVGGFGAASLWELENLIAFGQGTAGETSSFLLSAVKRVKIGPGWARGATRLMIFPYVPGINAMSVGLCVSFDAPDEATGKDGVFALHTRTRDDAQALATALQG